VVEGLIIPCFEMLQICRTLALHDPISHTTFVAAFFTMQRRERALEKLLVALAEDVLRLCQRRDPMLCLPAQHSG
jgi:hypothetical protein